MLKQEINENLARRIKKHIYGKPQTINVTFPPGMREIALDEARSILSRLWFQQKYASELSFSKNTIRIDHIHLFAATELLMRSQCVADVRLVIFAGNASGKFAFEKKCREVPWDYYLNKNMSLKIKVNSVASHAFHESGLRETVSEILAEYADKIMTGENAVATTTIYVELYKDKLTISISLAGNPLYKRGYRGVLSASAPLREDIAACCTRKALQFAHDVKNEFVAQTVMVPFSGTGTFLFEYLLSSLHFSPALFEREYALQKMPLFRQENFNFLLKKAQENCLLSASAPNAVAVCCIDHSAEANTALLDNMQKFKSAAIKNGFPFSSSSENIHAANFLQADITTLLPTEKLGNVFMPINPPYGIRLGKKQDATILYKNIAKKINAIAKIIQTQQKDLLGFILCPTEASWAAFCDALTGAKMETYHCMQGGLDIRVCQFFI